MFLQFLESRRNKELPILVSKYGNFLGEEDFIDKALDKYDRRQSRQSEGVMRSEDLYFEPAEKVIWKFERIHGVKIEDIALETCPGKRLRSELLILLKDKGGLKYVDICKISLFRDLRLNSLPKLYRDAKRRRRDLV